MVVSTLLHNAVYSNWLFKLVLDQRCWRFSEKSPPPKKKSPQKNARKKIPPKKFPPPKKLGGHPPDHTPPHHTPLDQTPRTRHPLCEQNDKQVYKYYLGHNFVAAGKHGGGSRTGRFKFNRSTSLGGTRSCTEEGRAQALYRDLPSPT